MSLLDLPVELLDSIIALALLQGSFEDFMLTCRTAYAAGKDRLNGYNALKQKWRTTRCVDDSFPRNMLDILNSVAEEPVLMHIIKSLDLSDANDQRFYNPIASPNPHSEESCSITDTPLGQLIEQSPYLARAEENTRTWSEAIRTHHHRESADGIEREPVCIHHRTIFLLTLLPGLDELALPSAWNLHFGDDIDGCQAVLRLLVRDANENPDTERPLGRLQRLLPYQEIEYDAHPRGALRDVSEFIHLPRLTSLEVSNLIAVDDGYTGIPFNWQDPELPCRLTTIDLTGCCIDATSVTELLENAPLVTSFSYSHGTKWHGCQHDWDAGSFIRAIGKHAGVRLSKLCIRLHTLFGQVESGVTSLQEFAVLQDLELDVAIFNGPPIGDSSRYGIRTQAPSDWSVERIPVLSSMLPASIKTLTLGVNESWAVPILSSLFADRVDLRAGQSFPNLERVALSGSAESLAQGLPDELSRRSFITLLEECGIESDQDVLQTLHSTALLE